MQLVGGGGGGAEEGRSHSAKDRNLTLVVSSSDSERTTTFLSSHVRRHKCWEGEGGLGVHQLVVHDSLSLIDTRKQSVSFYHHVKQASPFTLAAHQDGRGTELVRPKAKAAPFWSLSPKHPSGHHFCLGPPPQRKGWPTIKARECASHKHKERKEERARRRGW